MAIKVIANQAIASKDEPIRLARGELRIINLKNLHPVLASAIKGDMLKGAQLNRELCQ
ncbi:hypothetical protein LJR290_007798 [Variovorax sp. LjRoot290]|uniref:hypothetical protein n=1 Tax=Variovorax sp. LjRoot290 TaxID=3342316 RepID=UPI003ECC335D